MGADKGHLRGIVTLSRHHRQETEKRGRRMSRNIMNDIEGLIERNPSATGFCVKYKIRTRDGMNYTIMVKPIQKPDDMDFATYVKSEVCRDVLDYTNAIEEKPDAFTYSTEENVSVLNREITRVWSEADSFTMDMDEGEVEVGCIE